MLPLLRSHPSTGETGSASLGRGLTGPLCEAGRSIGNQSNVTPLCARHPMAGDSERKPLRPASSRSPRILLPVRSGPSARQHPTGGPPPPTKVVDATENRALRSAFGNNIASLGVKFYFSDDCLAGQATNTISQSGMPLAVSEEIWHVAPPNRTALLSNYSNLTAIAPSTHRAHLRAQVESRGHGRRRETADGAAALPSGHDARRKTGAMIGVSIDDTDSLPVAWQGTADGIRTAGMTACPTETRTGRRPAGRLPLAGRCERRAYKAASIVLKKGL